MTDCPPVVVVGTGAVGLACALALAHNGIRVTVLGERPEDPGCSGTSKNEYDTRVFALNRTARLFLSELGVWESVLDNGVYAYRAMSVWSGDGRVDFDAATAPDDVLGYIAPDNAVRKALFSRLETAPPAMLRFEMLTDLERHACHNGFRKVTTDSGDTIKARLVIGADSACSRTRALLGVKTEQTDYNQSAVTAVLRVPEEEGGRCRQRFFEDGVAAFLPLDRTTVSVVWSCATSRAEELHAMSDGDFAESVSRAFETRGTTPALMSERVIFPLRGVRAKHFVVPGAVLIGDAAHTVHPMAGLGFNLGLADVRDLTQMMVSSALVDGGRPTWSVLRRYQRTVARRHSELQLLLDGLGMVFAAHGCGMVNLLREAGLNGVNRCPSLKNYFMRRAIDLV